MFIKGSELWEPDWIQHEANVYYAVPDEALFDDKVYLDSGNPFRVALASTPHGRDGKPEKQRYNTGDPKLVYTCGQVFVNGILFTQVPFIAEVEAQAQAWTYGRRTDRIYVNFGPLKPAEQTVELTTRRRLFAPHVQGLGHIVV